MRRLGLGIRSKDIISDKPTHLPKLSNKNIADHKYFLWCCKRPLQLLENLRKLLAFCTSTKKIKTNFSCDKQVYWETTWKWYQKSFQYIGHRKQSLQKDVISKKYLQKRTGERKNNLRRKNIEKIHKTTRALINKSSSTIFPISRKKVLALIYREIIDKQLVLYLYFLPQCRIFQWKRAVFPNYFWFTAPLLSIVNIWRQPEMVKLAQRSRNWHNWRHPWH